MRRKGAGSLICAQVFAVLLFLGIGDAAWGKVHVQELRVGFGTGAGEHRNYKLGKWAPARVLLRCEKEQFHGELELSAMDSDDVAAGFRRPVYLRADETVSVPTYVKVGKIMPDITVRLRDSQGRVVVRSEFKNSGGKALVDRQHLSDPMGVTLIVALGRPTGLELERIGEQRGYLRSQFRVAQLDSVGELPSRWYGYEAVDRLILCLSDSDPAALDAMDGAAQTAIERWVRHGGHLIVCVGGASWPQEGGLLAKMLPADFGGVETVTQLPELESYLDSRYRLDVREPLSVPRLTNLRGRVLVGPTDLPLAVQGPFGLGFVTLVALDTGGEPFASWEGRTAFWLRLLGIHKAAQRDNKQNAAWMQRPLNDLSSLLRLQLERFAGVAAVPFQLVAFLVFFYILLIGPVDYLLVRKVLKRMGLTWVTFPCMVIGVSVAAYFTAYWLKGDQLRINKVDVLDVDQASGTYRGTSWLVLFSPQIKRYDLMLHPAFPGGEVQRPLLGGPSVIVSWLGLPEDSIGGMKRRGGIGLLRRRYRFGPDAQSLIGVPVEMWSMKGLTARWHGRAGPVVDTDLVGRDRIGGWVTNRLDSGLEDCVLAYGRHAYTIGDLPASGSIQVNPYMKHEDLRERLRRLTRSLGEARRRVHRSSSRAGDVAAADAAMVSNLISAMMFYSRLPQESDQLVNDYFRDLDLSEHLGHQRAILVARIPTGASKLALNGQEATQNLLSFTFLRVLLPVRSGRPGAGVGSAPVSVRTEAVKGDVAKAQ